MKTYVQLSPLVVSDILSICWTIPIHRIEPTKVDGFVRGDTVRAKLLMDELVNEFEA
jgi:hypothetical protein